MKPRPNDNDRFTRDFPVREIRADEDSGVISGYAAVFDQETLIGRRYREVVRRGAFANSLASDDIFAFWNHNFDIVLGRNKNQTLTLREDDQGLYFEIRPPNTVEAQGKRQLIRDGFVDKVSFSFTPIKTQWQENEGEDTELRELLEVKLWEVSPVPFPAYQGTSVGARAICADDVSRALKDGSLSADELRSLVEIQPSAEGESEPESSGPQPGLALRNRKLQLLETRLKL